MYRGRKQHKEPLFLVCLIVVIIGFFLVNKCRAVNWAQQFFTKIFLWPTLISLPALKTAFTVLINHTNSESVNQSIVIHTLTSDQPFQSNTSVHLLPQMISPSSGASGGQTWLSKFVEKLLVNFMTTFQMLIRHQTLNYMTVQKQKRPV